MNTSLIWASSRSVSSSACLNPSSGSQDRLMSNESGVRWVAVASVPAALASVFPWLVLG